MSDPNEINAGPEGTYALINRAYRDGRSHQWAVEIWRNYVQAVGRNGPPRGDEQLMFDFCPFNFTDEDDNPVKTAWKRRAWNNGPPMDPAKLLEYFRTIGKGESTSRFSRDNLAGAYGHGTRAAILPHSGLMVLTTEPGGDTEGVYIYDTGKNTYRLADFFVPGDEDDEWVEAVMVTLDGESYLSASDDAFLTMDHAELVHPTVRKQGGVTFILTGPDILDDYVEGDAAKKEGGRRLVDDLTEWVYIEDTLPVTVRYLHDPTPGDTRTHGEIISLAGRDQKNDPRKLHTYDKWFDRVLVSNQATIDLDDNGTQMDVYLLDDDWNLEGPLSGAMVKARAKAGRTIIERDGAKYAELPNKDSWFPYDGKGFIVIQYTDADGLATEMIPVGSPRNTRLQQMKPWGVTNAEVATRTAFVIRPPVWTEIGGEWGVAQNDARSGLVGPDGVALPWDEWRQTFFEALTTDSDLDFLRKAIEQAPQAGSKEIDPEDLKRLRQQLKGRLDLAHPSTVDIHVTTEKDTGEKGDGTDEEIETNPDHFGGRPIETPKKVKRRVANPNPKGKDHIERKTSPFMPRYTFLDAAQWAEKSVDDPEAYKPGIYCVVVHTPAQTDLFFNMGHEIYISQRAYYTGPFWKGRETLLMRIPLGEIENVIQTCYATEGVSKVFYAYEYSKEGGRTIKLGRFNQLVEGDRMTIALGGYVNVDHGIKSRLGGLTR